MYVCKYICVCVCVCVSKNTLTDMNIEDLGKYPTQLL